MALIVQDDLTIIKDILKETIPKLKFESKLSECIIAKRLLAGLEAGCDINDVVASGGGSGGQEGITFLKGFKYLIERTDDQTSIALSSILKSMKLMDDDLPLDKSQEDNISTINIPTEEREKKQNTPKLSRKQKRRNKAKKKKKLESAFAAAITREEEEGDGEVKPSPTIIRMSDLMTSSSIPNPPINQRDSNYHNEIKKNKNHAEEAPEDLNFLTLSSEQRKKAFQNIQKRNDENQKEEQKIKQQTNPSNIPNLKTTDFINQQGDNIGATKGEEEDIASDMNIVNKNNEEILKNTTSNNEKQMNNHKGKKQKDEKEKENEIINITSEKTVKSVLFDALNDLKGDIVFKPMKDMLMKIIMALQNNQKLNDEIDIDIEKNDDMKDNSNISRNNSSNNNDSKSIVKNDEEGSLFDEDEEVSFFEAPSQVEGSFTVQDAFDYVIRSCMVRTAIKVAQALSVLQQKDAHLLSLMPAPIQKTKKNKIQKFKTATKMLEKMEIDST